MTITVKELKEKLEEFNDNEELWFDVDWTSAHGIDSVELKAGDGQIVIGEYDY